MLLVIGSTALALQGMKIPRRKLDNDIIATKETIAEHLKHITPEKVQVSDDAGHIYALAKDKLFDDDNLAHEKVVYEYEVAWEDTTSAELLEAVKKNPDLARVETWYGVDYYIASPGVVLALKLSHRYKKNSRHFLKTMRDIQFLRKNGVEVPKVLKKWLKRREKETYSYKHPKLMGVKKGEFFSDDGISYVYDHDSIHEAIAIGEKPAYTYYQPTGEQVGTSKEMFFNAPLATRLLGVLEESYVLSLERSIIPFNLKDDPEKCKQAFDMALSKVCTSITSGWFREFSWENFDLVNSLYDQEYVKRFYDAVERGEVRPYVKEN